MLNHGKLFSLRRTTQSEPLPRTVPNSAGGHAFAISDWARLDRAGADPGERGRGDALPR